MSHNSVKLDTDLYPIYASYKKTTNAVVRWIATAANGNDLRQDGTKWTLKEMKRAAATVAKSKRMDIPLEITYAFQEAIAARKEITIFYKQHTKIDSIETKKHENFTETLKGIYKLLCGSEAFTKNGRLLVFEPQRPLPLTSTNIYETLPLVPSNDTNMSAEDPAPEDRIHASDGKPRSHQSAESPKQTFGLKDDGLADMFEIYYVVTSLDLACTKIKEAWAKAAAGSTSTIFAAWLTTAAVTCLRDRFEYGSFSVSLDANNHRALYEKYAAFLGIDNEGGRIVQLLARDSAQSGVFSSGHGLFCPTEAIIRGASAKSEENIQAAEIFEKPEDFVTVKCAQMTERQYGAESVLMDKVLDSMKRRLLASEDIRLEFLCSMNPLIKDIHEIYRPKDSSNGPNASITTKVVFGLQLLVESYKSFMLSDQAAPKTVNCRIQMLKLAQDVKNTLTNIRTSRPFIHDRCCDNFCSSRVLSSDIWTFELDLMVLTKQKIFDLYYQAPWVAGSQMLEILSRATLLGVDLCNRWPIVWAVLHLYNLLRQCGALDNETVLFEHLCSAIGKQVFWGKPPQRDFWTRYKVCNGGRIEFDRSKRQQTRREHSPSDEGRPCSRSGRNWRVTMPNQHTVYANDNHQINPHQTSVFAGLYKCRFQPSCCAWSYVWHGTDRTKYPTDEHVQQVADEIAAHPFVFSLDHLVSAVGPELQGSFPMARLNWFEIFLTVTEILSEMGKAAHVECVECVECRNSAANTGSWVGKGRFAVEQILQRADADEDSGMSKFRSRNWRMVEQAGNAIRGAVRGRKTSDYVWDV